MTDEDLISVALRATWAQRGRPLGVEPNPRDFMMHECAGQHSGW